jgi:hypothetical protein
MCQLSLGPMSITVHKLVMHFMTLTCILLTRVHYLAGMIAGVLRTEHVACVFLCQLEGVGHVCDHSKRLAQLKGIHGLRGGIMRQSIRIHSQQEKACMLKALHSEFENGNSHMLRLAFLSELTCSGKALIQK